MKCKKIIIALSVLAFSVFFSSCSADSPENADNSISATEQTSIKTDMPTEITAQIGITEEQTESALTAESLTDSDSAQSKTAANNIKKITLTVYPFPPSDIDKGGYPPIEYNGKRYISEPVTEFYTIDPDGNVSITRTGDTQWEAGYTVERAVLDFKSLEYLGEVEESTDDLYTGAKMYMYEGNKPILIGQRTPDLLDIEALYGVRLNEQEKNEWLDGRGERELGDILADRGIEFDPSIYYWARAYLPENE